MTLSAEVTVYSGRSKSLVEPLFDLFTEETGIEARVRYGGSAELAATIMEEGRRSPADVFFSQDAGPLGLLAREGRLAKLPRAVLDRVSPSFRGADGEWVGVSGRARVAAYSTLRVDVDELPDSVLDLTGPEWKGRIGWAPTNASFQSFVTALRVVHGDKAAGDWLMAMNANEPREYTGNSPAIRAVAAGEIDVALVNHYYLHALRKSGEVAVENFYFPDGDVGSLVNVAGAGILEGHRNQEAAVALVEFLLGETAQTYFAEVTAEYPLASEVPPMEGLPPLEGLEQPEVDLSSLEDLRGTLNLLRQSGVLP